MNKLLDIFKNKTMQSEGAVLAIGLGLVAQYQGGGFAAMDATQIGSLAAMAAVFIIRQLQKKKEA